MKKWAFFKRSMVENLKLVFAQSDGLRLGVVGALEALTFSLPQM